MVGENSRLDVYRKSDFKSSKRGGQECDQNLKGEKSKKLYRSLDNYRNPLDSSIVGIKYRLEFVEGNGFKVPPACFHHCCDGRGIGNQRIEGKSVLTRNPGQQQSYRVGHGKIHSRAASSLMAPLMRVYTSRFAAMKPHPIWYESERGFVIPVRGTSMKMRRPRPFDHSPIRHAVGCFLSHSRKASFIRVCHPRPNERKDATISASNRTVVATLVTSFGGRPRDDHMG